MLSSPQDYHCLAQSPPSGQDSRDCERLVEKQPLDLCDVDIGGEDRVNRATRLQMPTNFGGKSADHLEVGTTIKRRLSRGFRYTRQEWRIPRDHVVSSGI